MTYQHKIKAQSREVKRLEKEGLKLHKQPRRDVARFRAHLVDLTNKLDGLTTLHADHARTLLRESQDTSARIVDASCSLVRAEVDIFESLARKGWTGGGLDDLLDRGQDLFANDDAGGAGANAADPAKLFSILPPKSILADSASDASRLDHDRADGLLPADDHGGDRPRSFAASATASTAGTDTTDATSSTSSAGTITAAGTAAAASTPDSVVSPEPSKPRHPRPFSPQPIRRIPTDVTFESLGALAATEPPGPARRGTSGGRADAGGAEGKDEDKSSSKAADGGDPGAEEQQPSEAVESEARQDRGRKPSQSTYANRRSSLPGPATTDKDEADGN
ncbi:Phospholipid-binding protein [Hirsutella rhossiliensis]|uniref:Phospholipid-binding protein n=1 Tax=Hirsutella rhossiliensis TaxID=111463 RepID=A0A9P8SHS4_9HYPO|nr:Phospholipid-binding protein [Hirsutella rhossiliensis]KAH0961865.1 Phospholipid-binding protein [Hirsutella rhossiliensis]